MTTRREFLLQTAAAGEGRGPRCNLLSLRN